jgi:hypothetical protein
LINEKEAAEQLVELKKMLLPEMVPDKLKYLNVGQPEGHDDLFKVLESSTPGTGLIELLGKRIEKAYKFGSTLVDNQSHENTELGNLNDNILIICKQLMHFSKVIEINEQNNTILENIITTAITIGYTAGSHDMKANLERHGAKGYKSSIITPKKAGDKKSEQSKNVKELVSKMVDSIRSHPILGVVENPLLSNAISTVIYKFKEKGNNKDIAALKNFKNNFPEERTILIWIKKDYKESEKNSNLRQPTLNKIEKELVKVFPEKSIKKILIK